MNTQQKAAVAALVILCKERRIINTTTLGDMLGYHRNFIARVMWELSKKNIIAVRRGVNGGYLARAEALDVSVLDVVALYEKQDMTNPDKTRSEILKPLVTQIDYLLSIVTIGDLVKDASNG